MNGKRIAACLLAVAMILTKESTYHLTAQAQNMSEEAEVLTDVGETESEKKEDVAEAGKAFEELLADHEVYALLYRCRTYKVVKEAVSGAKAVVELPVGHQVRLLGVEFSEGQRWYQVETMAGGREYQGYLPADVLVSDDEGLADWGKAWGGAGIKSTFLQSSRAGSTDISAFPSSYQSGIRELVKLHPNWTFVPMNTNIDWDTMMENEMYPARNLISMNNMDTWKESDQILSDPYWVQASESLIRYYADPRNFLNETSVFQFELLSYNSASHTEAGVKAILKNTFMATNTIEDGMTYAKAFMKIGKELNVSPYHLAGRVRQEQGPGTSDLISGTYPGYEGLYNYFNIQAFGVTREEIIQNGLNEAREAGWTTRYAALYGGSEKVSNNYIKVGQNTRYLQKFDVDDSDGTLYWHQYMQALQSADSEAKTVKAGYEDMGVLNNSFVFRIPIYNNMPAKACEMPKDTINTPTISGSVSGYTTVTLKWSETSGAQGYEIYRSLKSDSGFKKVATIPSVGTTSWSEDIGVGKIYYYKVRGYKTFNGISANAGFSAVKKASTVIPAPSLNAPKLSSYKKIDIKWEKVNGVSGYKIYRKTGTDGKYQTVGSVKTSNALNYTDSTVIPGNTYYYKVRAYKVLDGENYDSSYSAEQSQSTKLEKPTLLEETVAKTNSLQIKWKSAKWVDGYRIYRAGSQNGSYQAIKTISGRNNLTYTDKNLEPGKNYFYKIKTYVDADGSKKLSAFSSVITGRTKLTVPTTRTIKATAPTTVKLTWKKTERAEGYEVYRASSRTGKYTKVKDIGKNTTLNYTEKNLVPNKTYYYKVRAYSTVKGKRTYSGFSPITSVRPKLDKPEIRAVTGVKATSVTVRWKKVGGAQGYRIYRAEKAKGSYKLIKDIENGEKLAYTDKGLKKGKTYYYKVRAFVKVSGTKRNSGYSKELSARTKK